MTNRRYTDQEIAEIFRRATDSSALPDASPGAASGMSLAELQAIGSEAGIPAERVEHAARSLDRPGLAGPTTQRLLGLPIAVTDTAELPTHLSDADWDQLVVTARDLFAARGQLRQEGSFRQWTNGNLNMLLEPGPNGNRLRLRTYNGFARSMMLGGIGALGITAVVMAVPWLTGNAELFANLDGMAVLGVAGMAMLARGVFGLRRWSDRRRTQFRQLIEQARRRPTSSP